MARRGRKRRLSLEDEYWELIRQGVGTVEACARLGIGRKTGYRWRAETGGAVPSRQAEQGRSGRFLSLVDRQRIASLRRDGVGIREIARVLGRAPSTVSRELKRNTAKHDVGGYDADLANARARERARRAKAGRLLQDPQLRAVVAAKLEVEWSPEQIAAFLRQAFPFKPEWHVCHETIYQALYHPQNSALSRKLTLKLRTGRPMRKRRRRPDRRLIRFIEPSELITQRPPEAEDRSRIGDWEGDLITGMQNKSAIATLVDRRTRLVRLVHLPGSHDAQAVCQAIATAFASLPATVRKTLTWDQGSEMAAHGLLADVFDEGVFFADPGSPWQRGTNENTNGLLRQYFPKGSDLKIHTPADLRMVEERLNDRPRKTLNWATPRALFTPLVGHSDQ